VSHVALAFPPDLSPGLLIRRYKRFLADVRLDDGREVIAHCPSPGAMTGLAEPGSRVWLAPSDDPRRKLAWSWILATDGETLVAFDGQLGNRLVGRALELGALPPLAGYAVLAREASPPATAGEPPAPRGRRRPPRTRLDFHLSGHGRDARPCWLEVKTATLGGADRVARFPDAPTARGRRHLDDLAELARGGARAVILYVVMRDDADAVAPADAIDPAYGAALREALAAGVEAMAWRASPRVEGVSLDRELPVLLP